MSNLLQNKTKVRPWMVILTLGVLMSSVITNRVDDFFNHNSLVFQSPVYVKANELIKPTIVEKTVVITATPSPTESPKKGSLLP